MNLELIEAQGAPKAVGPYSHAMTVGDLVFCSGQIPLDPATGELVQGDIAAQTGRIIDNIAAVLSASGSALDQVVKSLSEICAYAQKGAKDYELTISLETFDRSIEKKSLLGPTKDAVAVADQVKAKHNNFGLTIDLSHIPLLGETINQSLTLAKDHLIHAHIGNCQMKDASLPSYGDKHPRFGAPGSENDSDDLAEFLSTLMEVGFFTKKLPTRRPVVTFEVRPLPGERQDILMANCRRVMEEAWGKVSQPKSTGTPRRTTASTKAR
jgi:sugar phosphate isomerase/epimerase